MYMRKTMTIFMVVMLLALAVVMYIYWQSENKAITKGVLVDCQKIEDMLV